MGSVAGIQRPTRKARDLRNNATPAERTLWQCLNKSQLGAKFSRQMPVGPYICDFMCRAEMLVIELDGYSHDATPDRDDRRTSIIEAQGFRILRFRNVDVLQNVEDVVSAIRIALGNCPPPNPLPQAGGGG